MTNDEFLRRGGSLRARQKELQWQIIDLRRQPQGSSATPALRRELDAVTEELSALIAAYTRHLPRRLADLSPAPLDESGA